MAYYPPYVPDSYLQVMKSIPQTVYRVERVTRIEQRKVPTKRFEQPLISKRAREESGKGIVFDLYA